MGEGPELIAELGELCPGSATLTLSTGLAVANLALARTAYADEILHKHVAPEEAIKRLGNGS